MARIGYIVNAFPVVSETFVLNELRAVEGAGLEIAVFSLDGPGGGPLHGRVGELRAPIVRAPRGLGAWIAHLRFAVSHFRTYARTVAESRHEIRGPVADAGRRLRRYFQRFHHSVWIAQAASRLRVAHIHAHYAKEPLEIAERVHRVAGVPYSFTAHAKDLYTSPRKRLARRLRSATFALTCHKAGYEELRQIGGATDGGKVLLVAHGIDTDLFRPRRRRPEGNLILAVGRLTPKKGLENLVRACAVLRDRGRNFCCEIIGEGRMRGPLRREIEEHGLTEHVRIRRFVTQEELRRWYNRATVVASPAVVTADGNRDGLQNVILEGMACGVAVVGTDVGGIPEAIDHDRTGLLVPSGDVTALADAIESLLADPDRAERLGRAAAELMEKLDFRQTNLPLVERFREALAPAVEVRLCEVEERAWRKGGLADRAAEALGIAPVHCPDVEDGLRQRILPGLRANAWRPDLERIVSRRMWDELFKARNVRKLERVFGGALPIGRVLDLGCGRGGLSVALRALGHDSIGIDFRARNCQVTRFRAQRYAIEVPTCAAHGEQLPLADESFGLVCC
ncbi:MAG: glycosyltransferase, partial [Planctomycetota bacterium]